MSRRRALTLAALLPPAAAVLVAALALQAAPGVPARPEPGPADVERALALARQHDPRAQVPGRLRHVLIGERDADLLLHHLLRRVVPAETRLTLQPQQARLEASLPLPHLPLWLNLQVDVGAAGNRPEVRRVRLGRLPLPAAWVEPALRRLAAARGVPPEWLASLPPLQRLQFERRFVLVAYVVPADLRERLLAALLPGPERERVRAYAARLAALAPEPPPAEGVSLAALLPPLFALAAERSAAGSPPQAENRAALIALALYTNRHAVSLLMPAAVDGLPVQPMRVTLAGREDFPRHYVVSAALAADAGSPLADAVGLWKELDDARRGSGFSFNDLAADRAGTRLGELAVRDPRRLQARLAGAVGTLAENDILPPLADLPEFMPEREFVQRFGGVGAPAYQQLMTEVEARISALPIWN